MKNISELSHCYGCSLCAVICPQQIITLCQDKEGFYQPVIEKNDECTACGLCSKVCAFINDEKRCRKHGGKKQLFIRFIQGVLWIVTEMESETFRGS